MSPELSQLLSLQETDNEIKRLSEAIASLPALQQEIERQFSESLKEYFDLKEDLESSIVERRRIESDLAIEQQKLEKFKADLMRATKEREYATAVREIDVTKKTISTYETEVLKLMEKIEQLETRVRELTPEMESRRVEVDRQIVEYESSVSESQRRLEELTAERRRMIETLGPSARGTYNRVSRMRGGVVLAEARDYSCLVCRMKIRPQVYNDIRRGDTIITCESCGRILYYVTEALQP